MKKGMRWLVRIGLGICVLGLGLGLYVFAASQALLERRYEFAVRPPAIPTDAAELARGEHLVRAVYDCAGCHGADHGGMKMMESAALGRIFGGNLTTGRGSLVAGYTDEDWARAIRHGVGRDRRGLLLMSADAYSAISDRDLGAAIAYLRSLPPVDRELPQSRPGPIGRVLFLMGALPLPAARLDHARIESVSAPAEAPSLEYGRYLAQTSGCPSCHGPDLAGQPLGPSARSTNITPAVLGSWTEQDFEAALRRGVAPGGRKLGTMMPSERAFSRLTDLEVKALWLWARSLPPVPIK
jgi:mono/diheme cytochrome c family protein